MTFDQLPVEIIRNVTSFARFDTVFALTKVNKVLYHTCHDRLVYKSLVENVRSPDGSKWEPLDCSPDVSASKWARWAKADCQASKISDSLQANDFCYWGSHLMLSRRGYPTKDTVGLGHCLLVPLDPISSTMDIPILYTMIKKVLQDQPVLDTVSRSDMQPQPAKSSQHNSMFALAFSLMLRLLSLDNHEDLRV